MGEAKRKTEDVALLGVKKPVTLTALERFHWLKLAATCPTKGDGADRERLLDQLEGDEPDWTWIKREIAGLEVAAYDRECVIQVSYGTSLYMREFLEKRDATGEHNGLVMRILRRGARAAKEAHDLKPQVLEAVHDQ